MASKVRKTPARGFYKVDLTESDDRPNVVYVKTGHKLVKCTGDAHSNPHIDNCMQCINGTWGWALKKCE